MIEPAALIDRAREWIGVPFLHQGRNRNGVDCIGLLICVRNELEPWPEGMAETRTYHRRPVADTFLAKLHQYCERAPGPAPGVAILVGFPSEPYPNHVALCCGETMVHSYQRHGAVCEVGYRAHWSRWTHSFWRIPGVRYE